jgi:hypothetical protein
MKISALMTFHQVNDAMPQPGGRVNLASVVSRRYDSEPLTPHGLIHLSSVSSTDNAG